MPFSSHVISKMSGTQLERAAITPYLFVQKLLSPDPHPLRERVVDFSPTSSNNTPDTSSLNILNVFPGGRFVLAYAGLMVMLYDMGHPFSLFDGHRPQILASKAVAYDYVKSCCVSLDNTTHLVCLESWWETEG